MNKLIFPIFWSISVATITIGLSVAYSVYRRNRLSSPKNKIVSSLSNFKDVLKSGDPIEDHFKTTTILKNRVDNSHLRN